MKISSDFFEAFLKCPTKCWLRFTREPTAANAYAEWMQVKNESYRAEAAKRLTADLPADECASLDSSRGDGGQPSPPEKSQSLLTSAATIETCLHAVERMPSAGRGKPAQFIPIRFIYRDKLTKDDKLLLAF